MAQTGSLRTLKIGSQDFDLFSDVDVDRLPPQTTEMMSTTGRSFAQVTKQNPNATGFDIAVPTGTLREIVLDFAASTTDIDLAYTNSNGDSYTASGRINITADSTKEGKISADLMPVNGWTPITV